MATNGLNPQLAQRGEEGAEATPGWLFIPAPTTLTFPGPCCSENPVPSFARACSALARSSTGAEEDDAGVHLDDRVHVHLGFGERLEEVGGADVVHLVDGLLERVRRPEINAFSSIRSSSS